MQIYIGMSADIVHSGHINIIKKASKYGLVTVGLLTDEAIASYKRIPYMSYEQRKIVIGNIKGVSRVIAQKTLSYKANLEKLKPHFVMHGDDWKEGVQSKTRQEVIDTLAKWDGKLIEIPYTKGISSTILINSLNKTKKRGQIDKIFNYYMPTKIVYGINSLDLLDKYIDGRKALLVTSKGFIERGLVQRINLLTNSIVGVISEIKSHPEFKDLEIIYNRIKNIEFDIIVAVGGGSVLDASKFFSVQNQLKEYKFVEDLTKGHIAKKDYKLIPIISIPTTAGTGSEITPWATIWDMDEKNKYSLHLPNLFSEVAIYDPMLTLSVPYDITIQTGLDTLSHALESIWNKNANPITINYAIKSAKLIVKSLIKLSKNLDSIEYRDECMRACMYAGLAFSNTQTALAHGLSYYITAHKGVEHGIACSFTLPMLIDEVIGEYDFIDNAIIDIFGELSSQKLRDILQKLNISTKIANYNITDQEFEQLCLSLGDNQRANNSLVKL